MSRYLHLLGSSQPAPASMLIFPITVIPAVKFSQKSRRRGSRVLE
jgi:hypothetical protein